MNVYRKTAMALATAGFLAAGAANAELIDFTKSPPWKADDSVLSSTYSLPGLVSLTSNPAGQVNFTPYDGGAALAAAGTGLALNLDGVGVKDDEVTGGTSESLTVKFAKAAVVVRLDFMDLFKNPGDTTVAANIEKIQVQFYKGAALADTKTFSAVVGPANVFGGYLTSTFAGILADRLVFKMAADSGKDDGTADAAVAAIGVVPIPAAAWLFGSAILGLVAVGRRKLTATEA